MHSTLDVLFVDQILTEVKTRIKISSYKINETSEQKCFGQRTINCPTRSLKFVAVSDDELRSELIGENIVVAEAVIAVANHASDRIEIRISHRSNYARINHCPRMLIRRHGTRVRDTSKDGPGRGRGLRIAVILGFV